jgi:hypothetical protein
VTRRRHFLGTSYIQFQLFHLTPVNDNTGTEPVQIPGLFQAGNGQLRNDHTTQFSADDGSNAISFNTLF